MVFTLEVVRFIRDMEEAKEKGGKSVAFCDKHPTRVRIETIWKSDLVPRSNSTIISSLFTEFVK